MSLDDPDVILLKNNDCQFYDFPEFVSNVRPLI